MRPWAKPVVVARRRDATGSTRAVADADAAVAANAAAAVAASVVTNALPPVKSRPRNPSLSRLPNSFHLRSRISNRTPPPLSRPKRPQLKLAKNNPAANAAVAAATEGLLHDLGQLAAYVAKAAHLAKVTPISVDARVYDDAGAGDVDQLAYAIATEGLVVASGGTLVVVGKAATAMLRGRA